jgi:hypothetical protein
MKIEDCYLRPGSVTESGADARRADTRADIESAWFYVFGSAAVEAMNVAMLSERTERKILELANGELAGVGVPTEHEVGAIGPESVGCFADVRHGNGRYICVQTPGGLLDIVMTGIGVVDADELKRSPPDCQLGPLVLKDDDAGLLKDAQDFLRVVPVIVIAQDRVGRGLNTEEILAKLVEIVETMGDVVTGKQDEIGRCVVCCLNGSSLKFVGCYPADMLIGQMSDSESVVTILIE